MYSLKDTSFESNSRIKMNFNGGDLSSDAGLLLLNEFNSKMGFNDVIKQQFRTNDSACSRIHKDGDNLLQVIYQIQSAYFEDDCADELTTDPIFTTLLEKEALASQPTLSRFYNRMDGTTLGQFESINRELRRRVYICKPPEMMLFDLDSTLLETYGNQEGEGYNYHYGSHGYHPLICYDGLSGDLLKATLRKGEVYTSNGVCDFIQPLFDEFLNEHPKTELYLRGDSGFAIPELYTQCETNGTTYAIRLKSNAILNKLSDELDWELAEKTRENTIDYAVVYGEFYFQASTWEYPRRVVCKIEKPYGQITHMKTYIVTNMELKPVEVIRFYCNRGRMENFVKEGKNGFDFSAVSSHSKTVNANRFQVHTLAYNLFNWFRRIALPKALRKLTVGTIRMKLIKIAVRLVKSAGYKIFKLCSSCPYKKEFFMTLENIRGLKPQLE